MPLGRTFHAAKRAQHALVCNLSGKMNPALFLTDDTILQMGSWLNAMYLLVDGSAVHRSKAKVLRRPPEKRLHGLSHDVAGEDITVRLCTDRQVLRHYEVIARATSHCLVIKAEDFVEVMSKGELGILLSPMKRYAAWLMLRDYCLYNPRLVHEHVDFFAAVRAKIFAKRLHRAVAAKMAARRKTLVAKGVAAPAPGDASAKAADQKKALTAARAVGTCFSAERRSCRLVLSLRRTSRGRRPPSNASKISKERSSSLRALRPNVGTSTNSRRRAGPRGATRPAATPCARRSARTASTTTRSTCSPAATPAPPAPRRPRRPPPRRAEARSAGQT